MPATAGEAMLVPPARTCNALFAYRRALREAGLRPRIVYAPGVGARLLQPEGHRRKLGLGDDLEGGLQPVELASRPFRQV